MIFPINYKTTNLFIDGIYTSTKEDMSKIHPLNNHYYATISYHQRLSTVSNYLAAFQYHYDQSLSAYVIHTNKYAFLNTFFLLQRITIPELLNDEWFKKDFKQPDFVEKEKVNFDDVEAAFQDSEVSLPTLLYNII